MKIYLPKLQKSSGLAQTPFNIHYGLCLSVAVEGIKQGMAAHQRIYEACLRLGMENLLFNATELCCWLGAHDINISMATAQRALVDTTFFRLVTVRKTGRRGRPTKIYTLVKPDKVGEKLGLPMGASVNGPELNPTDLSATMRYKLAFLGRVMNFMEESQRKEQKDFWGWSKPTLIRWTQEVCEISPQYIRISSHSINFTALINGDESFLWEVRQREATGSHRYWLEVVNTDGVICKLPCSVEIARRWLPKSEVVICEQQANRYRVRSAYRDTPLWASGAMLDF